jgi:hypothetical protein
VKNKLMCTLGGIALLTMVSASIGASAEHGEAFSISAHPSVATVQAGERAAFSVIVSSRGFEGTVALSCQSGARRVACAVSPSSVWVSPTLTASVKVGAFTSRETPPGTYDLTITATSAPSAHPGLGPESAAVARQSTLVTLLVE